MFKSGYFSIYFTHLKLPLLSLFFLHITPRIKLHILSLRKFYIDIFNSQKFGKCTMFLVGVIMKKI